MDWRGVPPWSTDERSPTVPTKPMWYLAVALTAIAAVVIAKMIPVVKTYV